jgi:hypothetical protein
MQRLLLVEAVRPLAIRRCTRRLRRHAAGVLVVLALGGMIAVHHNGMAMSELDHDGMGPVIELCVGVSTAVGAAVAGIALPRRSRGRWPRPVELAHVGVPRIVTPPTTEARAGPPALPLLCVWRR